MITASTYLKERLFSDEARLRMLHDALLTFAHEHGWQLEAWAVFSNHYHFIACPPGNEEAKAQLNTMIARLHKHTASALNALDGQRARKVWHNFHDSHLTFPRSYLGRLNYVHNNPVKHRLVKDARDYPWCSAAWFERTASAAWIKTVSSFKTDKLKVEDDF